MSPSRRRRRASPEWEGREIITVAALPGRGLYVRHLGHPEGVDGVHRPTVPPPGAAPRPPAAFEPRWLAANLEQVDLVHVHGVPPRLPAAEVTAAVAAVRAAGKPLVATAYHLADPAGTDPPAFAAQLDALLPEADSVLTLTEPAAAEIRKRWGVTARVLPHPHVADFVRMRQDRPATHRGEFVVGVHLGRLRMPADPVQTVSALAEAARDVPDLRLAVHLHDQLLDRDANCYAPQVVREIEALLRPVGGALRVDPPMTDAQLWDHLFALDASILPPVHGSHSIWPEACFDLGTLVIAPGDSPAAHQRPGLSYERTASGAPEPDSLHKALTEARSSLPGVRADPGERWKERVAIAETLRGLYENLLGLGRRPLRPV